MSKKSLKYIKKIIICLTFIFCISCSLIVLASPNLEYDIKNNLSIYINHLNNGDVSNYYNIYNTRKLNDIEKTSFYDKIKNTTQVINSEKEIFNKFKLKIKLNDVKILNKINKNIYLCNININYQVRENINTTKTIKKQEDYLVKILYVGKEGYKILLPFNSMDKDFSQSRIFKEIEQIYKDKKAKVIEEERIRQEESEDKNNITENKESQDNTTDTNINSTTIENTSENNLQIFNDEQYNNEPYE